MRAIGGRAYGARRAGGTRRAGGRRHGAIAIGGRGRLRGGGTGHAATAQQKLAGAIGRRGARAHRPLSPAHGGGWGAGRGARVCGCRDAAISTLAGDRRARRGVRHGAARVTAGDAPARTPPRRDVTWPPTCAVRARPPPACPPPARPPPRNVGCGIWDVGRGRASAAPPPALASRGRARTIRNRAGAGVARGRSADVRGRIGRARGHVADGVPWNARGLPHVRGIPKTPACGARTRGSGPAGAAGEAARGGARPCRRARLRRSRQDVRRAMVCATALGQGLGQGQGQIGALASAQYSTRGIHGVD